METIKSIHEKFLECTGISTDSRNIKHNQLFVALKGENFDGNRYAEQALKYGAKYVIIDNPEYYRNSKTILCEDSLKCLQDIANYHRLMMKATVIAITGTNGKTTTKELINAMLSSHYNCIATQGNLNNHIGVPLTLLRIKPETEYAIIEMGANHPGEIKLLSQIAEPDYGLITNVGQAHIEGFGSFEGVKKTKKELYDFLFEDEGIAFVNSDNMHLIEMLNNQEIITYGFNSNAWCNGNPYKENNFVGMHWECDSSDGNTLSSLRGIYNAENILAAICIGNYFQVPKEKIQQSISNYKPTNQRSEIRKTELNHLLLDLYNANPSSMEAALKDFYNPNENQTLILGDMKELGNTSKEAHKSILELIVNIGYKTVFLSGENFYQFSNFYPFNFYLDTDALYHSIEKEPLKNSWILIKGSRSMKLEKLIPLL
jgi:UDP-N-acetylmuramoyl-tripeptide--D-alanyl-D-alanine ligase